MGAFTCGPLSFKHWKWLCQGYEQWGDREAFGRVFMTEKVEGVNWVTKWADPDFVGVTFELE